MCLKLLKITFCTNGLSLTCLFSGSRYDFDRDGYIIQEDVRLILSHVPIENNVVGHVAQEGIFTTTGGGR